MTDKTAIDTRAALRWLLGAALIGGGLRAGVSLAHRLGTAPSVKLRDSHDLYDPEIEMPVDMTPEQYQKYQSLAAPQTAKAAGAWDTTFNVLSGAGGGILGWKLMSAILKRRKQKQLDQQLDDLRTELAHVSGRKPPTEAVLARPLLKAHLDGSDPKVHALPAEELEAKIGAAWDFLEIAAQRYVRHYKQDPVGKIAVDQLTKTAGVLDVLKASGKTISELSPMTKLLIGGGALTAASPLIPGVRDAVEGAGKAVTNTVTGAGQAMMRPVGYGVAAFLGPIAALSLLYGLNRGYGTAKDRDKRIADLKALREAIREQEIKEQPYFKLVPRLKQQAQVHEQEHAAPVSAAPAVPEAAALAA